MASQGPPTVSSEQMRLVDELVINQYGLKLMQMMENAGRCLAALARDRFLKPVLQDKQVVILAGTGGNGGGGLVAARRLQSWGAQTTTLLAAEPADLDPVPAHQLTVLRHAGGSVASSIEDFDTKPDLIIDALLGYSQKGDPRPPMDALVDFANASSAPTISLDVPTGINPDTGAPSSPAISAAATLTLALPKIGLRQPVAQEFVGELWLADISIPPGLYQQLELDVPTELFAESDLIQL